MTVAPYSEVIKAGDNDHLGSLTPGEQFIAEEIDDHFFLQLLLSNRIHNTVDTLTNRPFTLRSLLNGNYLTRWDNQIFANGIHISLANLFVFEQREIDAVDEKELKTANNSKRRRMEANVFHALIKFPVCTTISSTTF